MTESASVARNDEASEPVLPHVFPEFDWLRVQTPIVAGEKTIWPGPKETYREWVEGFPFELHPFAWDYMWIRCDGYRVEIKPHYVDSTWDTFWTDGTGHVKADGLGGLFPWTLGKQAELLDGIVATLDALAHKIAREHPDVADKIQQIHGILKARERAPFEPIDTRHMSALRVRLAERFWRWKIRRLNGAG